ncbi:MAG: DUF2185 domain-containing protein [Gemmataceae bacterium]
MDEEKEVHVELQLQGACLASNKVTVDGLPVGYMYRVEPNAEDDTGWCFLSGTESREYMDNSDNHAIHNLATLASLNPDIIPFLDAPVGARYLRDPNTGEFVEIPNGPIELYLQQATQAAAQGNRDFCITIQAKDDANRWIQLKWDCVNAAYPFSDEPLGQIGKLGVMLAPDMGLLEWEPNKFATFEHSGQQIGSIAQFVLAYLQNVLDADPQNRDLQVIRDE